MSKFNKPYFENMESLKSFASTVQEMQRIVAPYDAAFKSIRDYQDRITAPLTNTIEIALKNSFKIDSLIYEQLQLNSSILKTADLVASCSIKSLLPSFKIPSEIYSIPASLLLSPEWQLHTELIEEEEQAFHESKETDEIIISKILGSDLNETTEPTNPETAIITAIPVTSEFIDYFISNPSELYQLTPREFEVFMADIYTRLGYHAQCTQSTRDGGKDIILTQDTPVGNFVYYVECKKYSPKNHVGVGIIRELNGVIGAERVNGGFVATTSFFSKPARDYIRDSKLDFMLRLHDFDFISNTLKTIGK